MCVKRKAQAQVLDMLQTILRGSQTQVKVTEKERNKKKVGRKKVTMTQGGT